MILTGSLLWAASAVAVSDAAMRLASATGLVEIKAALMEEWIAVEPGELLLAGDLVRTPAESSAQVTCPDGSQLQLAPETTLDIRKMAFESDTRLFTLEAVLWQGQVVWSSQPRNPISTQRLRTPDLTVEPLDSGAQVELAYARTGGSTVAVLDQAVKLIRGETVAVLRAGQSFPPGKRWDSARGPVPPLQPADEPREAPPEQAQSGPLESLPAPSSPQEAVASSPLSAPAFEGIPLSLWQRMSPDERADLEVRFPTLTEEQREALRRMTVAQWQAARSVARTLTCQLHLQQIGAALQRYAEDHEGTLPAAAGWQAALQPYLDTAACWDCPEEGHDHTPDYLLNRHLGGVRLSDLRQPRLTVLVFEGLPRDASYSGEAPDLAPRHEGAVNILFADGHVRTMALPLYRNVRWQP